MSVKAKGHPRGLYTLFATEMWERFSYYGMRALLVLYLTAKLAKDGFGLPRDEALALYAVFTGLVYLTPILGGWVADKLLGKRKTVYIGGLVMAIGQFLLATSAFLAHSLDVDTRLFIFNFGLGVLILGNGFFKPNISTIVGDFYDDNDPRKDSAFNIFYMGINLGAILGPFIAGALGEQVHWGYGFTAAGVGMVISVLWLKMQEHNLERFGLPPNSPEDKYLLDARDWRDIFVWTLSLVVGAAVVILVWSSLPDSVTEWLMTLGFLALILGMAYVVIRGIDGEEWMKKFTPFAAVVVGLFVLWKANVLELIQAMIGLNWLVGLLLVAGLIAAVLITLMLNPNEEWSRMGVIITLAIFNIAFWAGFEQAGGTMNLFAKENTDRTLEAVWAPDFIQNLNIKWLGYLCLIFVLMWIYDILMRVFSDDEQRKALARKIGGVGMVGTIVLGVLLLWAYLSTGPEIPASWFQNINPFAILVFAPLFSIMWLKLDQMRINPRTSIKFVLGLALGGVAFWVMSIADHKAETGLVSPMWLVTVYVILTLGELMLSPIGLSMITKLAPTRLVSVVMGLWMASFAAGNYIAGILENVLHQYGFELYPFIMWVMFGCAVVLLLFSPLLNRAMRGIH